MNKKVLTLCAAMLLTGSLATLEAASISITALDAKPGVEVSSNVIKITKDVDLKGDYLLIDEPHMIIEGDGLSEDAATLYGRIVITAKDVTVRNLKIVLNNEASNATAYKNAITVYAPSAKITGNEITCKSGKYLANGISIFPSTNDATFVVEGNTIIGAASKSLSWQSSGILLSENVKASLGDDKNTTIDAPELTDFDVTSISNNIYIDCAGDYSYTKYNGANVFSAYHAIQVAPLKGSKEGEYLNQAYITSLVEDADENTKAIFKGKAEDFIKATEGVKTTKDIAIVCNDYNVLFNDAKNPNGNPAVIADNDVVAAKTEVDGYKLIKSPAANQYGLLIITTKDWGEYIVSQEKDSKAKVDKVASGTLSDYEHAEAALWRMECSTALDGTYQYKFVNKLDEVLKATGANADSDAKNGIFKSNMPYGEFGVVLPNIEDDKKHSFGLYKTADNYFTGNQLIKRYGDYFTLGITYKNDKNKDVDVTGEFKGQLRPAKAVEYKNGEITITKAGDAEEFMLVNEKNEIIVIDLNNPLHQGSTTYGYAFKALPAKEYSEWKNTPALREKYDYQTKFQFAYDYNSDVTTETVSRITIAGLTMGLEEDNKQIKLVADYESKLLDEPTFSIKLNAGNGIAAKDWLTSPSYYTIEAINKDKKAPHYGKVLGLNEYGQIAWVAPENVDLTKPEGQFAIDQNYNFKNRENKNASLAWNTTVLVDGNVYKVAGEEDVYAVVTPAGNDTLRISAIKTYKSYDGFKRFTASQLNANTYKVAMKALNGDVNIIENHNDKHRLGLDEENYTEWRIEMPTVKLLDATEDFTRMAADTVKIETPITYYVAGKGWVQTSLDPEDDYYAPNTELQICTYVLKNTDNNEYLNGVNDNESAGNEYYVCNADKKTATRVAFKENGEESYNLVPAYGYYGYYVDNKYYYTNDWMTGMSKKESEYADYTDYLWLSSNKIIGGVSTLTGVLKDEALYKATTNDLFVIEKAEAPTYKKLAQDDKIILTLKENLKDEYVLFEDGDFAGMGNRLAHKDINPTLYVDTAYVNRVGNYAYQYLLSVRPTRIDTTYQCNLPEEHGVHRADTTKGFFLVNMVDSAKANQNVHNNKFMYDGEYKLAFVEGYHTNDSLFFTEDGKVVSKMEVGNGDFNIAKYAFKMVDETENEFVVETASGYSKKYNKVVDNNGHEHWTVASVESKPGYLRWVNDNLVVTEDIDKAAIFTMEASDKEATANENIAAGNVVVAGVDGAVVVKGAEGKNVIVSTILGKVVANEVVSSDNATIAAPAGIVVVSVDGESFKVVVK